MQSNLYNARPTHHALLDLCALALNPRCYLDCDDHFEVQCDAVGLVEFVVGCSDFELELGGPRTSAFVTTEILLRLRIWLL